MGSTNMGVRPSSGPFLFHEDEAVPPIVALHSLEIFHPLLRMM